MRMHRESPDFCSDRRQSPSKCKKSTKMSKQQKSKEILPIENHKGKPILKNWVYKTFAYYVWLVVLLRLVIQAASPINRMDIPALIPQPDAAAAGSN